MLTRSQADRLARRYRTQAGKLLSDMMTVNDPDIKNNIKLAHDALCRAFMRLERKFGL